MNLAAIIVIFGIIGVSLVVLTGWAGQVSLGQMAFVAVGAAVGGGVTDHVGLGPRRSRCSSPAVRRRGRRDRHRLPGAAAPGLTLAVSTLAFALFVSSYLLNQEFFDDALRCPAFRIERHRPVRPSSTSATETRFYFLCLAVLALSIIVVRGVRRSRTGPGADRDPRERPRGRARTASTRTRTSLAGFALSGFLAAFAGVLFVHHQTRAAGRRRQRYLPSRA